MRGSEIDLSIIVPAYNEAERLPRTLIRLHEYLSRQAFRYEIIVVLDGPTDDTRERLERLAPTVQNLQVLDNETNHGKGYAVRTGMLRALGRIRLFTDADNSTDISHFDKMAPLFDTGYDVVIGSRHSKDAPGARQSVPQRWYKRLIGHLGNILIQIMTVKGIRDTQCGFKAFRDYAAEKIFSQAVIDRWGFDIEVLALARQLKYKIGIIPVEWINDPRSHVDWRAYFDVLWDTVKVRWNMLEGRYQR